MLKQFQVTLKCATGQYRPVSTIITREENTPKKEIINDGIVKICQTRLWGKNELVKYNYTKVMMREYDAEKVKQEKIERQKKLKQSWKK